MDYVFSVSRQYGSGGRIFAERLAQYYQIPLYDKEIIEKTAEESGISIDHYQKADERRGNTLLLSLMGTQYGVATPIDISHIITDDKLFINTSETIKKLAEKPCVILGRCADYILEDRKIVRLFISADMPDRVKSVMKRFDLNEKQAQSLIKKQDKHRSNYYNYYSGKNWGEASNYDLCLNLSHIDYSQGIAMVAVVAGEKA